MFLTGQHVVCIDGKFDTKIKKFYTALPVEGVSYVVRGSTVGISPEMQDGELCVYLTGLQNPCSSKPPYRERGFKAERFRPLEEMTEEEIKAMSAPEEVEV
jgi:hypothetical protein